MLTIVLTPGSLNHIANIVKGYAIAIGIVIAIGFVWMWWTHRQRERRQELAVRANSVWGNWLRLAISHPELAEPSPGVLNPAVDVVRYRAFVATLLATSNEVLLLRDEPTWCGTIFRGLEPHRAYLSSPEFRAGDMKSCSMRLRDLMAPLTAVA